MLTSLQRGYQYQLAVVAHSKSNNSIRATKRGINIIISIQEQDLMRHIRQHILEIYMNIPGQIINCCFSLQLATDSNMTPNSSNWIRLTWKKRSTPFSRLGSINSNKQRNPYKLHYLPDSSNWIRLTRNRGSTFIQDYMMMLISFFLSLWFN